MKRIGFLLTCFLAGYIGGNLGSLRAQIRPTGRQPIVFPAGDAQHPGLHVEGDPSTGFFSDQNGVLHFVKRGEIVQTMSTPILPTIAQTGNEIIGTSLTFSPTQSATFNVNDFFVNGGFSTELYGANVVVNGSNTLDLTGGPTPGPPNLFMFKPSAGGSGAIAEISATLNAMNGADTVRGLLVDLNNGAHTGAGNNMIAIDIDPITGSANAIETGVRVPAGFDVGITNPSVTQTNLVAATNGSTVYCSNCNPDATCTAGGAGAFAFRINGAWACELN